MKRSEREPEHLTLGSHDIVDALREAGWQLTRVGDEERLRAAARRLSDATADWAATGRLHIDVMDDEAQAFLVALKGLRAALHPERAAQANYELTMAGKIVLSVGFYPHSKTEHGHGEGVGHGKPIDYKYAAPQPPSPASQGEER